MDVFSEEQILKSKNLSKSVLQIIYGVTKSPYKIPRACLLNRSPVPAMDLKSNRLGL